MVMTERFQANGTAERDAAGDAGADSGWASSDGGGGQGVRYGGLCGGVTESTCDATRGAEYAHRSGGSAIDERTTRHAGYAVSQKKRKRTEESFGWPKTIAHCARFGIGEFTKWVGCSHFAAAAYILVRMQKLTMPAD